MATEYRPPRVTIRWTRRNAENSEARVVGVEGRRGYRYSQVLPEGESHISITVPEELTTEPSTWWARIGRDDRGTIEVDLDLTDGKKTRREIGEGEQVEWMCNTGVGVSNRKKTPTAKGGRRDEDRRRARVHEWWRQVCKLGRLEQEGRLFRGEAQEYAGPIKSGMIREWGLSGRGLAELEATILREARQYVSYDDADRLIAECQHIGIKMNVIDFTTCAKVALWFACAQTDGDGRIRIVEESDLTGRVIRPADQHPRIRAQRGVLIYKKSGILEQEEVRETLVVRQDDKAGLKEILRTDYGIERRTLFPDLEGFREEIEKGGVRFVRAELAAGAQAFEREDYERARQLFESCSRSWQSKHPERDGGFFNIVPLRNLAITLSMLGEDEKAIEAAEQARQIARMTCKGGGGNNLRVLRETEAIANSVRTRSEIRIGSVVPHIVLRKVYSR